MKNIPKVKDGISEREKLTLNEIQEQSEYVFVPPRGQNVTQDRFNVKCTPGGWKIA